MVTISQDKLREAFNGKGGTVPSVARVERLLSFDNSTTQMGGTYLVADANGVDPLIPQSGGSSIGNRNSGKKHP